MIGSSLGTPSSAGYLRNLSTLYGPNRLYGVSSLSGADNSPAAAGGLGINNLSRNEASTRVRLSDLGKLKSGLTALSDGLRGLDDKDAVAPYRATSSDENVARSDTAAASSQADRYALEVSQLASAQQLTSATQTDQDSTILGTGTLTLDIGRNTINGFSAERSSNISIASSDGTLAGIARRINQAQAGVVASVQQDSDTGTYRLLIQSSETGSQNSLRIRVADNDGTDTDANGLSTLAFDPQATTGAGRNLTETVAASDAAFTVDGSALQSQANRTGAAIAGVQLDLTGVGNTRITVARDSSAFAQSAKTLTESYNRFLQAGNGLEPSGLGRKISAALQQVLNTTGAGIGNDRIGLDELGIRADRTGKLSIDADKLERGFASNPDQAAQWLADVASGLQAVASSQTGSTSELQLSSRQLERTLQDIDPQRSVLFSFNQPQLNGLAADSVSSLLTYLPNFNRNSPIARYLSIAGM